MSKFKNNEERLKAFREWYANGGQDELDEAMERADKLVQELRKAREVDWSIIHQPMTI